MLAATGMKQVYGCVFYTQPLLRKGQEEI